MGEKMNDALGFIKSALPTIFAALGGPLAGVAVSAIGSILGVNDATQDKIAQAIQSGQITPEQIGKLKELELQYQNEEKERGFKYAELAFKENELVGKDRDSARQMQIATHSKMPAILTIMVTIGFFGVLIGLLMMPELKANEIVLVMVGQLSAVWGACVAFYVSTTYSSANKNQLLANSTPTK